MYKEELFPLVLFVTPPNPAPRAFPPLPQTNKQKKQMLLVPLWLLIDGYKCVCILCWYTDIRTFEILLRTYEIRQWRADCTQGTGGGSAGSIRHKRKQHLIEGSGEQENPNNSTVMARPNGEARGHTGYLTFARLKCLSWRAWYLFHLVVNITVSYPCINLGLTSTNEELYWSLKV